MVPAPEAKLMSHLLVTAAVIDWSTSFIQCILLTVYRKKNYLHTAQQHTCSATAFAHFEENIYCVFLKDKMKMCTNEVQCFLDKKSPYTKFSHNKRLDFLSLARTLLRIMLNFSTYKVLE